MELIDNSQHIKWYMFDFYDIFYVLGFYLFNPDKPNTAWLTDITYIKSGSPYQNGYIEWSN